MAEESKFVDVALAAAQRVLAPPLAIKRGAALLYEVTVDNNLALTVDPERPVRGELGISNRLVCVRVKIGQRNDPKSGLGVQSAHKHT